MAIQDTSGVKYFHSDHLGSATLTTDGNGGVYHQIRFNPYGSKDWSSGLDATDYDFTGQRLDGFGLLDYHARYYDATLGRFISPDSVVPGDSALNINGGNSQEGEVEGIPSALNRYTYVGNNPIRNTDPDGHCWPLCTAAIGAGVGGLVGLGLYAMNVERSGQEFQWSEAGVAITGGAVAGALIGTGVGAAAAISSGSIGAGTALAISSAGAGMAGAEAGYVGVNLISGTEFNSMDFAISASVGAGTGAISPFMATTRNSAMVLNATANAIQYEATNYAHTNALTFDENLGWAVATGGIAGRVAGSATAPSKFPKAFKDYAWDIQKFPEMVSLGLGKEATTSFVRNSLAGMISNQPCPQGVCK